ncbi:MAG: RNA polymerase sigma factor [Myxococcales bacterium]|nr:RNA polymerase sigma factor [Myxococcales bacterium]
MQAGSGRVGSRVPPDRDRTRFERLLLPVRQGLYRFALQLTGDAVRADDVLHQAVVVGLSHFDQLSAEAAFRAWMSRIVYRTFLDEQRRSGREIPSEGSLDNVVALTQSGPEQRAGASQLAARIVEALGGLPDAQARAVWLVDGQGFKYREVAQIMEIPPGTAATLVARGRSALRRRLKNVAQEQGVTQ